MALQDNNLMLLDLSNGFPRTIDNANDTLRVGVDSTFAQDLAVGGNLTVNGDIISGGTMDVVVSDNFIDLSNGQGTGANKAGGLTVNVQSSLARVSITGATFQSQASAAGAFATLSIPGFDPSTGGVGGVSLAGGDIIEISGAADLAGNNGLFVIEAVTPGAGGLIEIKNAPQTQTPFGQTNFEDGTESAAAASFAGAVDLGVFCISDGALLDIGGNPIPVGQFVSAFQNAAKISNLVYEAAANVSLQEAYNVGQQILLNDGQGNLDIRTDDTGPRADFLLSNEANTHKYLATSAGSLQVGDGATLKVNMAGQVSSDISFDGSAARNIQQSGQNIRLRTVTSGDVEVNSAGALTLQATDTTDLVMLSNDAGAKNLSIVAQNAGAGVGNVGLVADGNVTLNPSGDLVGSIGAKMDLNPQSTAADAAVIQAPNGGLQLSAGGGALTAVGISQPVSITAQAALASFTGQGVDITGTANSTVAVASGRTTIDGATGGVEITSAGANAIFRSTAQDLILETVTSGNAAVAAAGNVELGAASQVNSAAGTSSDFQAAGLFRVRSTGANLQFEAGADLLATSTGITDINSGGNYTVDTTNGSIVMTAGGAGNNAQLFSSAADVQIGGALGAVMTASGAGLELQHNHAGSILSIASAGNSATGAVDITAGAGGINVEATTQARMASLSANVLVEATAGAVEIDASSDSYFKVAGAGQLLTMESTNGAVNLVAGAALSAGGAVIVDGHMGIADTAAGAGYTAVAVAPILAGQICMQASSGNHEVSVADRTSVETPVGIALLAAANANDPVALHTLHGYPVATQTAAVAADIGKFLYLDAAGGMTTSAPTASGDYVWRLGTIIGVAGGNAEMIWAPQFIAKRP